MEKKWIDAGKGPFDMFTLSSSPVDFTDIKFSPFGKYIMLSTDVNHIFILDAFKGTQVSWWGFCL